MMETVLAMTRRRKQLTPAATPPGDFGPDIRHRDVPVGHAGYVREADTEIVRLPDVLRPERRQDIAVAVRWLPLRLFHRGEITKHQLGAAEWYRDLVDDGEGPSLVKAFDGERASTSSQRMLLSDRMVQARIMIQDADVAMGAERAALIKVAVRAATKTEVALALGVAVATVGRSCADVFEKLDGWRARYAKGRL